MSAAFVYGRRGDRLLHIRDLEPGSQRGARCGCVCPECGRPLVAHLGDAKSWHFQHEAVDVACNPQPMTLLHAYVRDELARRPALWLPGETFEITAERRNRPLRERLATEPQEIEIIAAATERRVGAVQPDVVLALSDGREIAVEVRKSHAVSTEKLALLQATFADAVELDVSDLPAAGVTLEELERALLERRRWHWLVSTRRAEMEASWRWEHHDWLPNINYFRVAQPQNPPTPARLRKAQARLAWAREVHDLVRAEKPSNDERAALIGSMTIPDRLAYCCHFLDIQPERLPVYFWQRVHQKLTPSETGWQLPVFAKFGLRQQPFSSLDVARWARVALPEFKANGLGVRNCPDLYRAALHCYLLQLEMQGLLRRAGPGGPKSRTFVRAFATTAELRQFLEASLEAATH